MKPICTDDADFRAVLDRIDRRLDDLLSERGPTVLARSEQDLLRVAKQVYRARQDRARFFRADLFQDPAWDILLDLFIATLEGRQLQVSSVCVASNAPATTALRYIKNMEDHGELIRTKDATNRKRVWLRLSDGAMAAMRSSLMERRPPPKLSTQAALRPAQIS